ncbi:hypothetical protein BJY52DRAFT_1128191 [Lactarius psammicola]|nr:hypothetical protein BJY52DRAFT_1128191 [Lactarius psammicola]
MASVVAPDTPRSDSTENQVDQTPYEVVARMTFHSKPRSSAAKGKKSKAKKMAKEVRAKEFDFIFAATNDNYILFLQTILEKHYLLQYTVSDQSVFPCKVQVPPSSKCDASYIINFDEYEVLANKILKRRPTKPITVFIDMLAVEKAFSKVSNSGLSKIDHELARLRCMLEKKYASDRDGSYAYIDAATATTIPLTPFMMKEWARAMYDGIATVNEPPRTEAFDVANRKSSLGPRNRASSSASTASGGADVSALAAISSLITSVATFMRPEHPVPTTPKVPDKSPAASLVLKSPPVIFNTPSKLERFLQAAESNGVPGVQSHLSSLALKGYGPDILHIVSVQDLVAIGVSPGDAIWLREYASRWWAEERQRVTKRPHAPDIERPGCCSTTPTLAPPPINTTPPNKRLRFEKCFNDGGGMTTFGRAIVKKKAGYEFEANDYTWWVYSKDLKMNVPLPPGKVPVLADDEPFIDEMGNVY